jgi:hypothetical protein
MAVIYKIHPGIGVARVGDSPDKFFIGPETASGGPLEFAGNAEQPLVRYKDDDHKIKRQGARFRIFAYDQQPDGTLVAAREVTANEAQITWSVRLVNRKAAWTKTVSQVPPRNPAVTGAARAGLVIDPGVKSISGTRAGPVNLDGGKFTVPAGSTAVTLGELRTDAAGRLIVLGGFGRSESIPPHLPVGGQNFADNPGWFDDVGDGPVTATVKVGDQVAVDALGAWVVVAPPDFAPNVSSVVTLHDIAMQAAVSGFHVTEPGRPSFRDHVQPILARAASLKWTNDSTTWDSVDQDWAALSHDTGPAAAQSRRDMADLLSAPLPLQDRGSMQNVSITDVQRRILSAWSLGNFVDDWGTPPAAATPSPGDYDEGPLRFAVGGGFFPGIEAGSRMKDVAIYSAAFRLRQDLPPGHLTEQMALPWQSDFYQCRESGSAPWWPAQRPDVAYQRANPNHALPWTGGIVTLPDGAGGEQQMVDRFAKLGFIKQITLADGTVVQVEDERDPGFPRPVA